MSLGKLRKGQGALSHPLHSSLQLSRVCGLHPPYICTSTEKQLSRLCRHANNSSNNILERKPPGLPNHVPGLYGTWLVSPETRGRKPAFRFPFPLIIQRPLSSSVSLPVDQLVDPCWCLRRCSWTVEHLYG